MSWVSGLCAAAVLGLAGFLTLLLWPAGSPGTDNAPIGANAPIPFAVMGDSGSHSYQDYVSLPLGNDERGGALRRQTFSWLEALARMRAKEIDPGPWVAWGRPGVIALARELVGLDGGRAPKKEDYLYNFANSGAACKNLVGDGLGARFRQAPRLVALMNRDPARWTHGVVVISIGGNDWYGSLELQSREPAAPALRAVAEYCASAVARAVDLIHASHPATRVLIVGVGNELDDPSTFDSFRSADAVANVNKARAMFNATLAKVASRDPRTAAFIDPDPWFVERWGRRGPNGEPDQYKTFRVSPTLAVTNSAGDTPDHSVVADLHAGLVWNAVWAQQVVLRLRESFGLPLTPISDEELARFVAETIRAAGS